MVYTGRRFDASARRAENAYHRLRETDTEMSSIRYYNRITATRDVEGIIREYPSRWEKVNAEILAVLKTGKLENLAIFMNTAKAAWSGWKEKIDASRNNPAVIEGAIPVLIRLKMVQFALEKLYISAASGQTSGKVRFNFINGYILQKLLFKRDFFRKPVNLTLFRIVWPFITQKKILMPLVARRGIYCFFSRPFVRGIARLIGDSACLEAGAGDGALAGFLSREGVTIRATDDYSWSAYVRYGKNVEKIKIKEALKRYRPETVICSWPPPLNDFERHIFDAPSVRRYIVVGSRHRFASGNREVYEGQKNFTMTRNDRLAGLILPKENDNEVLVFERK